MKWQTQFDIEHLQIISYTFVMHFYEVYNCFTENILFKAIFHVKADENEID